jgi:hypothetical protein
MRLFLSVLIFLHFMKPVHAEQRVTLNLWRAYP